MFFTEYGTERHPICARQLLREPSQPRGFSSPEQGAAKLRHVCTAPSCSAWTRFPLANREPSTHGSPSGIVWRRRGDNGSQRNRALTASNFERSREFYRKLLPFLGTKPVIDSDTTYYCVGGRTAVGISAPAPEHAGSSFEQNRVGLHHLCFRARRARRRRRTAWLALLARCENHSRAARGPMGAGILFAAVRRSRRNQAGAQPCSGKGPLGLSSA
jgi:hypothetical protein